MDYKQRTKIARIVVDDKVPVDSEIIILGMVRTVRKSKGVAFVQVNDGSCMESLQGVIAEPEKFPVLENILTEPPFGWSANWCRRKARGKNTR
jgi:asparaginyl-tRNA synthetase